MAVGSRVVGARRLWRWLHGLMECATTVRALAFVLMALAMPVANAAPCAFTWNITNDGRSGHYAHALSPGESAACLFGDSPYTGLGNNIGDMPAEGGGIKGIDWQTPSDTLFYTPPNPGFVGTRTVYWYDINNAPIQVTINVTGVPTVTAVSPAFGPTFGGNTVTISGTNFGGASVVRFGATAASFTPLSPTTITAIVPGNSAGTVDVTVTTASGTSATGSGDQYTYIPEPTIAYVAPSSGPITGGTSVTINGTGFTTATNVTFGGSIAAAVIVTSDTSITAISPPSLTPGTVDIRVTSAGGTSASSAMDQFTYIGAPSVSSISPNTGPASGGTSVTVTGTGFTDTTAVAFGGTPAASFVVVNDSTITATSPSGSGAVDVLVTTPSGTSGVGFFDVFTYASPPTVNGVTPTTGPASGGTSVTIFGSGFSGSTVVTFGGISASSFIVLSDYQITATSPAHAPGVVDIRVTSPDGTSATTSLDQFTYFAPAPSVSGVSPAFGPVAGGTSVTISGSDFTGATAVKFGATNASFTVNSPTMITATSPAHSAGVVDVTVTTAAGTSATSAADQFTFANPAPVAGPVSLTVAHGSSSNPVTLNLSGGAATSVAVAVQAAHGTATASGTTIFYTPAASYAGPDSFTYTATNASGTSSPATVTVTVSSATISYLPSSPAAGTAGVAYVQSLAGASGGTAPYSYAVLTGTLPAGVSLAPNGTLSGTPTATGSFSFTVRVEDSSSGAGPFHQDSAPLTLVIAAPTLAMSPANGSAFSGNVGTGFSQTFTMSGGVAPYQFTALAVTGGTMPSGLGFNTATGTLSGTPTSAGTVTFNITGSDSTGGSGSTPVTQSYTLTVAAPTLAIAPATLPNAVQGTAYNQTLSASGGRAPYSYVVTAGSLPSGLTLAPAGVVSGTPTTTGGSTFTITATDANGFTTSRSYNVVTNPAAPIAGPIGKIVPWNTATAIDLATAISGGAASSVTVTTTPTHGSVSISGTVATYTPAPGYSGGDSFGYSAANVSGSSASLVTLQINPQVPVAGAKSVTVAFDAATPIDLASVISGGMPTSLAVSAAPAHGSVSVSGTTITYTPTTGYNGTDSFSYTATNAGGTSAAAVVSLTVNPQVPVAGAKSVTVAFNAATPIDLASVITGGAPTSLAVSTQPGHGTVSVSGTTATYTPSAGFSGTDSFSYTATNAGGTSAAAVVSLTVNPQAPVAGAKSVTVAFNAATPIDLASVITGGAPTSLAVTTQPGHGTVNVSGTTATYTPSAGFSGTDSFSYTATNAGGTSAAAVVSMTINPQVPVANNVDATFTTGGSNRFTIALDIGGGAATGVSIVTQPAHGTVTVNSPAARSVGLQAAANQAGFSVTYVPNAGYVGKDSFTYTATNAGGSSTPATVSLQMNPPAPTVAPVTVTTVSGAPITVDVAARASGGPFTGLAIDSQPTEGKAVVQGLSILYTPTPAFVGTATIAYSLSNAYGTTQGTVTVTVNARLDPSRDPEVNGLVAAQADAARRFATAQLGNFNRRLERLHGNGWAGSNSTLNVSAYGVGMALAPAGVQPIDQRPTRSNDDSTQLVKVSNETGREDASVPAKQAVSTDARQDRLGYWIDGRIDLGQRDATTRQSDFDFRTDGISLGADYRLNDLASLGVGAGYARDESDIGSHGSRSTGTAGMVAIYGALRPAPKWFVDAVLGYGALDFDLDRYVTDTGDLARGSRKGDQVFGSLATGYEHRNDTWMISPYGRLDAMTTSLDGYTESATGVSALRYNEQTVRMTTGALGVRGEMLVNTRLGSVLPRGRFEYRHHFEGADNARVFYADLVGVGPGYLVSPAQVEQNQFVLGLGGTLVLRSKWAISLDFDSSLNNDSGYSRSIGARLDVPF